MKLILTSILLLAACASSAVASAIQWGTGGGGAFVGGLVIASLGLAMVGYVGAGIALIAMVCLMVYLARTQK